VGCTLSLVGVLVRFCVWFFFVRAYLLHLHMVHMCLLQHFLLRRNQKVGDDKVGTGDGSLFSESFFRRFFVRLLCVLVCCIFFFRLRIFGLGDGLKKGSCALLSPCVSGPVCDDASKGKAGGRSRWEPEAMTITAVNQDRVQDLGMRGEELQTCVYDSSRLDSNKCGFCAYLFWPPPRVRCASSCSWM
jgi:hypothetical protein